jgi:hypothetical protein
LLGPGFRSKLKRLFYRTLLPFWHLYIIFSVVIGCSKTKASQGTYNPQGGFMKSIPNHPFYGFPLKLGKLNFINNYGKDDSQIKIPQCNGYEERLKSYYFLPTS